VCQHRVQEATWGYINESQACRACLYCSRERQVRCWQHSFCVINSTRRKTKKPSGGEWKAKGCFWVHRRGLLVHIQARIHIQAHMCFASAEGHVMLSIVCWRSGPEGPA
jgi:hypothetical protein